MKPGVFVAILVAILCALAGACFARSEETAEPRFPPALGARILL